MAKSIKRRGFYDEKDDLPDYKPNFEYVQKRIGSAVLKFDTITGRKPMSKRPESASEAFYNYDYYVKEHNSHVFPRNQFTDLQKMLPKELDPESGLPSFMQTKRPLSSAANKSRTFAAAATHTS